MTQFGRALSELNIEILLRKLEPGEGPGRADERDATGSVDQGSASGGHGRRQRFPRFMERYNRQFPISPAPPDDLHRPMNLGPESAREVLSVLSVRN